MHHSVFPCPLCGPSEDVLRPLDTVRKLFSSRDGYKGPPPIRLLLPLTSLLPQRHAGRPSISFLFETSLAREFRTFERNSPEFLLVSKWIPNFSPPRSTTRSLVEFYSFSPRDNTSPPKFGVSKFEANVLFPFSFSTYCLRFSQMTLGL